MSVPKMELTKLEWKQKSKATEMLSGRIKLEFKFVYSPVKTVTAKGLI